MNVEEITKQDILDFFQEQKCKTCPFARECESNENDYDSISLCALFGTL